MLFWTMMVGQCRHNAIVQLSRVARYNEHSNQESERSFWNVGIDVLPARYVTNTLY